VNPVRSGRKQPQQGLGCDRISPAVNPRHAFNSDGHPLLSYQVIARKWRPQSFDEVSGQGHVTTALRNAIRSDRIPHAILLTGPRGVGKTTLARLIARCLNCEKGPTDEPCGSCTSCTEITESRSTDVQEIDAASRTGVDDIREVIESIRYSAAHGKYRIFIIDEVHMLSTSAFNALLKTLEEPPPRSLFVLATTNPEKIPFTVLSRCQRHDLRRIGLSSVSDRLKEICASEGIEITAGALTQIAREGDGSMRDAQTLLDQIVAYGGENITDETIAEVLDLVDRRVLHQIIEACIDGNAKNALESLAQATSGGSEARRIADALLELLRDLVVLKVAPDGQGLFDGSDEERAELLELAARTEPARLRRMFRALVREIEDLSWAPRPNAVLEMAIIRLATLPSGDDVGQLLSRLDQLERRLSTEKGPTGGGSGGESGGTASRSRPVSDRGPRKRAENPRAATREPDAFDPPTASTRAPSNAAAVDPKTKKKSKPEARSTAERPPEPSALGGGAPPEAIFDRFRSKALETDRSRYASLEGTELVSINGNTIALSVSAAFHAERLRARISDLEAFAGKLFGQPTKISVEIRGVQAPEEESLESREHSRKRRQQALNSEPVNLAIEILEAEIVEIRPLGDNH
jgi:DNA polymerase-3 subunit gamma/tau